MRGVALTALLDFFTAVMASLLTLFVPQLCPASAAVIIGGVSIAPTDETHLCSLAEQLLLARRSPLHRAAVALNFITLGAFVLAEGCVRTPWLASTEPPVLTRCAHRSPASVFLWRELWVVEHCDEDRTQPWAALSAQLAAYPSLAQRLDGANSAAAAAAVALAAVMALNFAVSVALAGAEQYGGYRTAVALVAFSVPAARRVATFAAVARESHAMRIALPLWGAGLVSLNCLDEACTRTGEDGAV